MPKHKAIPSPKAANDPGSSIGGPAGHRSSVEANGPARRRTALALRGLGLALTIVLSLVYAFAFLRTPIGEGVVDSEGRASSRGAFVLVSLLVPDSLVNSWFDGNRLPVAVGDRLPILIATLLWLGLATSIGLNLLPATLLPAIKGRNRLWNIGKDWPKRVEGLSMAALIGLTMLSTVTLLVGWIFGIDRLRLSIGIVFVILITHRRLRTVWKQLATKSTSTANLSAADTRSDLDGLQRSTSIDASTANSPPGTTSPTWLDSRTRGLFDSSLRLLSVVMTLGLGLVIMLGSWVPSSEFDVLEYHLQAPKEFFQQQSIDFVPHNIYANMPLGAEMHTLAMMALVNQPDGWLGGLIGKSVTASISLLGAALLWGFVARRHGSTVGWWAAGIWLASPGIAHVARLGLVDGVLAAYVLATAVALAWTCEHPSHGTPGGDGRSSRPRLNLRSPYWGTIGLLAGAAAATKYPGLVFAFVPACFAWCVAVAQARRSLPMATGWFGASMLIAGFLVTGGVWYAKNWCLAGNPVYPLAASVFGGRTLSSEKIHQWQQAHRVPIALPATSTTAERIVSSVETLAADGLRLSLTSPFVQPAMIVGLVAALASLVRRRQAGVDAGGVLSAGLVWSAWILCVWWLATHRIDRFWLPLTGLWAGAAAYGCLWLRVRFSLWLAHAIVVLGVGYGCLVNSSSLLGDSRFFVSINALRDDAGDENQIGRISPMMAWIHRHLEPSRTQLLLIGEADVFEYRVPLLYSTCFDTNPGEPLLRNKSAQQQLDGLKASGITHMMINWMEIDRYRSPGNYGFSDWPVASDIQQLVDQGVVTRLDWGIPQEVAELLEVNEAVD